MLTLFLSAGYWTKTIFNMVANIENFEKFIIKQIVNTVDYHPESDEFEFNRICISDELINIIGNEGARYGIEKGQIGQIISRVAENIRTNPVIDLKYGSIDVSKLKVGQHLKINILHPEKGAHYIELLVTQKFQFYVLASDIVGVRYGDEIRALDDTWNNGFYIDFTVSLKNNKHSDDALILKLGKLQSVAMFGPSVVHEILDSESAFTYDGLNVNPPKTVVDDADLNENQEKSVIAKSNLRKYYFWKPVHNNPVVFSWREGNSKDEKSPFVILEESDNPKASITINKAFKLPIDKSGKFRLLEVLCDVCSRESFQGKEKSGFSNIKSVKSVKSGIAKRFVSTAGHKEWKIIRRPQIEFVYE